MKLFSILQELVQSYVGHILRLHVSEDQAKSKYRAESTATHSQIEESTTSTFYEQGTPLKEKDPD